MTMKILDRLKRRFSNIDPDNYIHKRFVQIDDIWVQVMWNVDKGTYIISWQEFVPDFDEDNWLYATRRTTRI